MNDRELLEYAAKAAGYEVEWSDITECFWGDGDSWGPLEDDGDALRLAVKLNLIVGAYGTYTSVFQTSAPAPSEEIVCWYGSSNQDPYAATRRAIVRAAAEIGKHKEQE